MNAARCLALFCGLANSTFAMAQGVDAPSSERRYAVVIGANRGDPSDMPLRHAERDAARVGDVLSRLGQVPQENLVQLHGVSAGRVREVIDHMSARIEREASWDPRPAMLMVYYSGHADGGALHLGGTHLDFDVLTDEVDAAPAQVRVLVVDACRSGGLTRAKGAVPAETFDMSVQDELRSTGTAVITSSAADESSMESDRLEGGVFTHHFLAGLVGAADTSGEGEVTLNEAWTYAYAETLRSTSTERVVQHPTYAFDLRGIKDVVLTRLAPDEHVGSVALGLDGDWLVFQAGRAGSLITEVRARSGALLSLPPGSYLLRHRGDDAVSEGVVEVRAGETTAAEPTDLDPIPYGKIARKGWGGTRRSAWALTFSGAAGGPMLPSQGVGFGAALGARIDMSALTIQLRARYMNHGGTTASLDWVQHTIGAELLALKLFDLGRVAPGLGLRLGGDAVLQRFESQGEAPAHTGLVPRVGPVLRVEIAAAPRWSFGFEGGADAAFVRQEGNDGEVGLRTRVVPYGGVEVSWYAF